MHARENANGCRKTRQTFSFIDFKDVISELALHADSKMITNFYKWTFYFFG